MDNYTELINYINSTGGIPLNVFQTSQTSWSQFGISVILVAIGSIFAFIYLFNMVKPMIYEYYLKFCLRGLKRKGRGLVVIKHTESSLFEQSMINQETLKSMIDIMNKFKGKPFDLVLYTPGGEIFSSLYISRLLKNYKGKIRTYVPIFSMSGGTLLALSTDELYMGENACLGAIDPQLGNLFKFGSAKQWKEIVKYKGKKSEDSSISFSMIGEQYTKSMKEHLNYLLDDKILLNDRRKFVELLTNGEIEHGKPLTYDLLCKYGLNVKKMRGKLFYKILNILSKSSFEGVMYRK